jgi:hypothetical protein
VVAASCTSSRAHVPVPGPDQGGRAIEYPSLPYYGGCMAAVMPSLRAEPRPPISAPSHAIRVFRVGAPSHQRSGPGPYVTP